MFLASLSSNQQLQYCFILQLIYTLVLLKFSFEESKSFSFEDFNRDVNIYSCILSSFFNHQLWSLEEEEDPYKI